MQFAELRGPQPPKISFEEIHMRQPIPRQERFRRKGGRGDGALKIGDLLIASKVPKASDLAQSQDRPRNRFTAAAFRLPFGRAKGNVYLNKGIAVLRTAQFAAAPLRRTATRFTLVCVLRRRRTALSRSP